jgi:hypothetical protein
MNFLEVFLYHHEREHRDTTYLGPEDITRDD